MVKYEEGDLFKSDANILAHGCNCAGGFGSGVALHMSNKYPESKRCYMMKHSTEGWKLGDIQVVLVRSQKYVINCATQQDYYPRDRVHADYDAIRTCMIKVRDFAQKNGLTIAIPKIGAGLAGGDWGIIEGILNEVFQDYDVTVFYLK